MKRGSTTAGDDSQLISYSYGVGAEECDHEGRDLLDCDQLLPKPLVRLLVEAGWLGSKLSRVGTEGGL